MVTQFQQVGSTNARHGVDVYKAAVQAIPDNSSTACVFDTETADTDGYHDNVTNNTRFTVPAGLGGTYMITGEGYWESEAIGLRVLDIRLNGTDYRSTSQQDPDGAVLGPKMQVASILSLVAGDYVEMVAYQNRGGAATLEITCKFRMYRVSV